MSINRLTWGKTEAKHKFSTDAMEKTVDLKKDPKKPFVRKAGVVLAGQEKKGEATPGRVGRTLHKKKNTRST